MPDFYYPSENLLGYKFLNYGTNSDNQSQKTNRRMSFAQNLLPQMKKVNSEKISLKPRGSDGQLTSKIRDDQILIEKQRKSDHNTPDLIDQISEKDEGSSSSSNSNFDHRNQKKF